MPDSALSQAIKEAYAAAPDNAVTLHTLEFRHPNFINDLGQPTAIRVVRDHQDLVAWLEAAAPLNPGEAVTFLAFAFDFKLPDVEVAAAPEMVITIDNVSAEIEQNLARAVASPYTIAATYRPYLSTDLSGPQMNPPLHLTVQHVKADDFRVTARVSFGDLSNLQFPSDDYTATRFPGLAR